MVRPAQIEYFLEPVLNFKGQTFCYEVWPQGTTFYIWLGGLKIVFIDDRFFSRWLPNKFVRGSHHLDLDNNIPFKYDFFQTPS